MFRLLLTLASFVLLAMLLRVLRVDASHLLIETGVGTSRMSTFGRQLLRLLRLNRRLGACLAGYYRTRSLLSSFGSFGGLR